MKKAIILFNLGGPDKLENVEPFLFNLFYDPAILNLPKFLRYPLAKLISNRRAPIAKKIYEECTKAGIKAEVDLKNQKINYKIREHSLAKVPILLICGEKEVKSKSVTIRRLGSEKQEVLKLEKAIKKISQKNKPPLN